MNRSKGRAGHSPERRHHSRNTPWPRRQGYPAGRRRPAGGKLSFTLGSEAFARRPYAHPARLAKRESRACSRARYACRGASFRPHKPPHSKLRHHQACASYSQSRPDVTNGTAPDVETRPHPVQPEKTARRTGRRKIESCILKAVSEIRRHLP